MQVNPGIFKAYDIRGIVPSELNPAIAYEIGRALVATLEADSVVVGRDMRVSGPALSAALMDGIRDAGADVVDVGMREGGVDADREQVRVGGSRRLTTGESLSADALTQALPWE